MTPKPSNKSVVGRGPWAYALAFSVFGSVLLDLFLTSKFVSVELTEGRVTFFLGSIVVVGSVIASIGALAYVESLKGISGTFRGFVKGIIDLPGKAPEILAMSPKELAAGLGLPKTGDGDFFSYDSWYDLWLATRDMSKDLAKQEQLLMVGVLAPSVAGMVLALVETLFPFNIDLLLGCFDLIVTGLVFFAYLVWMFSLGHSTILDMPPPLALQLRKKLDST